MSEPCSQKKIIQKMSELLVGNGHPEDGLAFKVAIMAKTHNEILETVKEIKSNLSELKDKQDENFQTNAGNISATKNSVDLYIKEMSGFQNGIKNERDKTEVKFKKTMKIIASVIAVMVLIVGIIGLFNYSKTKNIPAIETKVDRIGKPIIDVKRGLYYFPVSDSIYRMDSLK